MIISAILIYFLLCITVAWFGRDRRIGFTGFLILSVIFSPFLMALILLLGGAPKSKNE